MVRPPLGFLNRYKVNLGATHPDFCHIFEIGVLAPDFCHIFEIGVLDQIFVIFLSYF